MYLQSPPPPPPPPHTHTHTHTQTHTHHTHTLTPPTTQKICDIITNIANVPGLRGCYGRKHYVGLRTADGIFPDIGFQLGTGSVFSPCTIVVLVINSDNDNHNNSNYINGNINLSNNNHNNDKKQ